MKIESRGGQAAPTGQTVRLPRPSAAGRPDPTTRTLRRVGLLGIGAITAASVLAAVLITFLELFVAFLQAFIFMFLTAVFISLMSHHDEEHEHEETPAAAEPAVQPA